MSMSVSIFPNLRPMELPDEVKVLLSRALRPFLERPGEFKDSVQTFNEEYGEQAVLIRLRREKEASWFRQERRLKTAPHSSELEARRALREEDDSRAIRPQRGYIVQGYGDKRE